MYLPNALAEKYPKAARTWGWQFVFPSAVRSTDPRTGIERRHHLYEASVQRAVREAAENAEDFADSEYALGEFIDRYGPRLAHFNGVLQLLAQLGAPQAPAEPPAEG